MHCSDLICGPDKKRERKKYTRSSKPFTSDEPYRFLLYRKLLQYENGIHLRIEGVVIYEIWDVGVWEGVERHSISPALVEILDVDVIVAVGLTLAPQQQRLLGLLLRTSRIAICVRIFGNLH